MRPFESLPLFAHLAEIHDSLVSSLATQTEATGKVPWCHELCHSLQASSATLVWTHVSKMVSFSILWAHKKHSTYPNTWARKKTCVHRSRCDVILKVFSSNLCRLDPFFSATHQLWKDSYACWRRSSMLAPGNKCHRQTRSTSHACKILMLDLEPHTSCMPGMLQWVEIQWRKRKTLFPHHNAMYAFGQGGCHMAHPPVGCAR